MAYDFGRDAQLAALNVASAITGNWYDYKDRTLGPYNRYNENALGAILRTYGAGALFWPSGAMHLANGVIGGIPGYQYDQTWELDQALLRDVSNKFGSESDAYDYWNSLDYADRKALADKYYDTADAGIGNLWGLTGNLQGFNVESFLKDLEELNGTEGISKPVYDKYVDLDKIESEAKAAIEAENQELLASLNQELANTSAAYNTQRNAILANQFQQNAQTIDAMSNDMSRARRSAIEAGASAGVRIAGNVNAILSAQNKMSQQSLETSNQLAQMLVNQRNAESGLRNQWRDVKTSTYDRTSQRANSEYNRANARYDQAMDRWQNSRDANVSATNALASSYENYQDRNKAKSTYSSNTGSNY